MSKFKIPILANCGHCKNKIRNVDLCKQNDGCFLCPECDQEDILRKFHSVSQNLVLLTNSKGFIFLMFLRYISKKITGTINNCYNNFEDLRL